MAKPITIKITGDDKGFRKSMDRVEKSVSGMSSGVVKAAGLIGGAFAAAGVVSFAGDMFNLGADLEVMSKKAETVFGGELGRVEDWAEGAAAKMGLTRNELVGLTTAAGDLLKPMGFNAKQASNLSTEMTGLAGALAMNSQGKVDSAGASEVLQKALLGERDGLQALGIKIDEEMLKERLAADGKDKLTGAALKQARTEATLALVTEQSTDAITAYANADDTLLVQKNKLQAKLKELREDIATKLTPVFATIAAFMVDRFVPALERVGEYLEKELTPIFDMVSGFITGTVVPAFRTFAGWVVDDAIPAIKSFADEIEARATPIIETVAAFITDTLVPALQDLGRWVRDDALPAVQTFATEMSDRLKPVIDDIATFITDDLVPAFQDIATWVRDNVIPVLQDLGTYIRDDLLEDLTNIWNRVKDFTLALKENEPALAAIGVVILAGVIPPVWAAVTAILAKAAAWAAAAAAMIIANAPIVLIIAAMAALAAGVVWAYQNVDLFRAAVDLAAKFLKDVAWPAIKWVFEQWWDVVSWVFEKIVWAVQTGIDIFQALWDGNADAVNGIIDGFQSMLDFITGLPGEVTDALKGIWDGIPKPPSFITDGIGSVGGFLGFARGGNVNQSGSYTVGERGPETVFLPGGSQVVPNHAGGGTNGGVNVYVTSQADPWQIGRETAWAIRTGGV